MKTTNHNLTIAQIIASASSTSFTRHPGFTAFANGSEESKPETHLGGSMKTDDKKPEPKIVIDPTMAAARAVAGSSKPAKAPKAPKAEKAPKAAKPAKAPKVKKVKKEKAPKAAKPAKAPKVKKVKKEKAPKAAKPAKADGPTLFGHSIASVCRALGAAGWTAKPARAAIKAKGITYSDLAVSTYVQAGKAGERGEPAPLTKAELADLKVLADKALATAAGDKAKK